MTMVVGWKDYAIRAQIFDEGKGERDNTGFRGNGSTSSDRKRTYPPRRYSSDYLGYQK